MHKKSILFLVIFLLMILGGVVMKTMSFKRITGILVSPDIKDGVKQIDFSKPDVNKTTLEEYTRSYAGKIILKEEDGKGFNVILYENGNKKQLFYTGLYIWEQPILTDGGEIFFIASNSQDDYENAFLFKYADQKISQISSFNTDWMSKLLYKDDFIIIVKNEEKAFVISRYNIDANKFEDICIGRYPFWGKDDDSLFYAVQDGKFSKGLAIISLSTLENMVLNTKLRIVSAGIYNHDNNVILIWRDDPDASGAGIPFERTLFFLDSGKVINVNTYFRRLLWKSNVSDYMKFSYYSFWVE